MQLNNKSIQFVRRQLLRISLFNEWSGCILLTFLISILPRIGTDSFFEKVALTFHSVFSVLTQKNLPKSIINQMDASGMLHGCHMMSTLSSHFSHSKHSISWISKMLGNSFGLIFQFSDRRPTEKWKPFLLCQILIINTLTVLLWIKDKQLGQAGFG